MTDSSLRKPADLTRRTAILGAAASLTACATVRPQFPATGFSVPLDTDAAGRLYITLDTPPVGPGRFMLDTGSSISAVFRGTALAAALPKPGTQRRVWGLGGAAQAATVTLPEQTVIPPPPDGIEPLVVPPRGGILLPRPALGEPATGLIGMDVLAGRTLGVDRTNRRLIFGAAGTPTEPARGWDRIPLETLSALPGGRSLYFAQTLVGRGRFAALIDLGSDSTYFSWTIAEASEGLRKLRRSLRRRLRTEERVEGAVATFRPAVRVYVSGLTMADHQWPVTEVTIREVPSEELLGVPDTPVIVAGMNLLAERDFVFDAVAGALMLRRADSAGTQAMPLRTVLRVGG